MFDISNLSVSEKFAVCEIKHKDIFFEKCSAYLLNSLIVELALEGCIEFDDRSRKKTGKDVRKLFILFTGKEASGETGRQLLNALKDLDNGKLTIYTAVIKLMHNKEHRRAIATPFYDGLLSKGAISENKKKGFFGTKTVLAADENCYNAITEEVRYQLLSERTLNENMLLLASLLDIFRILGKMFTKEDRPVIKKRRAELKKSPIYTMASAGYEYLALVVLLICLMYFIILD